MPQPRKVQVEPKTESINALKRRVAELERLVEAIEEELSDETLTDEQCLVNIAERVAQVTG